MTTLHEMFPELAAQIVSEQEEIKRVKKQRDDVLFGEITRKEGESFEDAYFRTNDKNHELHRRVLALERRQWFLYLERLFVNPILDAEKKVISAENHTMRWPPYHSPYDENQWQALIDLHDATGLTFQITKVNGIVFPINGILSYQDPEHKRHIIPESRNYYQR